MKESIVKNIIELFRLLFDKLALFGYLDKVINFAGCDLTVNHFVKLVELIHVYGAEIQKLSDIDILSAVCFLKPHRHSIDLPVLPAKYI